MLFKPAGAIANNAIYPFASEKRKQPIGLDSESYSETGRVKLPAGFVVDETPEGSSLDAAFGAYRASYKVDNGTLLFTRSLEVKATTVPAAEYSKVRDFFGRVSVSEGSPVVLIKHQLPPRNDRAEESALRLPWQVLSKKKLPPKTSKRSAHRRCSVTMVFREGC
jgi:hypothetical protein